jgi:hypothetical protein
VFAYIGYLSFTTGQDVDKVIQAGQGLSFVVFPYAGKGYFWENSNFISWFLFEVTPKSHNNTRRAVLVDLIFHHDGCSRLGFNGIEVNLQL